jgi:hypothetical protein
VLRGVGQNSSTPMVAICDKEFDMFKPSTRKMAPNGASDTLPARVAIAWAMPVHFDATLVMRLVDQHRELNLRFDELVAEIHSDANVPANPQIAADAVRDCAGQLHDLRRAEALWLYPVIAREFAEDPVARRLFWQARLTMLSLARGLLRRFEELAQALQEGKTACHAADHVATAFAEYRRRNEAEMYPLYNLMQLCELPASQAA